MAIATVSPSVIKQEKFLDRSHAQERTNLKLVANTVPKERVDRKVFAIFLISVAIAGLLALLGINTALSQGAFELSKLNVQATMLNDQREAVMKRIAKASSPEVLAYRAKKAGMVPSQSPRFLVIGPESEGARSPYVEVAK